MADDDKDKNFAKLREKLEAKDETIAKLKKIAVQGVVSQAGLDPSKPLVGLVTEKWEASIEDLDDLTPNNFKEFSEPFELTVAENQDGNEGGDEADDDDDDLLSEIEAGQEAGDKAGAGRTPSGDDDPLDAINKAQAEGDFQTSFEQKISLLPGYDDN